MLERYIVFGSQEAQTHTAEGMAVTTSSKGHSTQLDGSGHPKSSPQAGMLLCVPKSGQPVGEAWYPAGGLLPLKPGPPKEPHRRETALLADLHSRWSRGCWGLPAWGKQQRCTHTPQVHVCMSLSLYARCSAPLPIFPCI